MRPYHSSLRLLILVILLVGVLGPRAAYAEELTPADALLNPGGDLRWAVWNPTQYALADDGAAIWIGATGGIVRFDKATNTYERYTTLDGLPHTKVLAVTVDGLGNRWFGGDGGLTVLWANGRWQQFDSTNSGLRHDLVDGIAVAGDNTLWISHGLPDGSVSRRNPDGTWDWFPNRETAIALDFDRALTTRNRNPLWTLAGSTVWVDWAAFDGNWWYDRTPPDVTDRPTTTVADGQGRVWALIRSPDSWSREAGRLFRWDDDGWNTINVCESQTIRYSTTTALDADNNGVVWIASRVNPSYPTYFINVINRSDQTPRCDWTTQTGGQGAIVALLAEPTGAWALGPGWLVTLEANTIAFDDQPINSYITNAFNDADDNTWVLSIPSTAGSPPPSGRLQAVNDNTTSVVNDDRWPQTETFYMATLSAVDRAPSGDLWLQGVVNGGKGGNYPLGPLLRYNGQWVDRSYYNYGRSPFGTSDIFVQDDRTTWFTAKDNDASLPCKPNAVLKLDDGGTPASQGDDTWTSYPAPPDVVDPSIAVDSLGQLWLGDKNGLYRLDGNTWQPIDDGYGHSLSVCDLAALPDGTVVVQDCDGFWMRVVRPDRIDWINLDELVRNNYVQVRASRRINSMWTVALDGGVWYVAQPSGEKVERLYRFDDAQRTTPELPFPTSAIDSLDVDRNNHVWIAAANNLWRLAPRPDFSVDASSVARLLTPGQQRGQVLPIIRQEGFNRPILLWVTDLPAGVTAEIQPNPVASTETAHIILTISPQALPGDYTAILHAESVLIVHETTLRIRIAAEVHEHWLPLIAR